MSNFKFRIGKKKWEHVSYLILALVLVLNVQSYTPDRSEPIFLDAYFDALNLSAGQVIFDTADTIGAYLGMTHNVRIAGNIIDTNPRRYLSETLNLMSLIETLKRENVSLIIDERGDLTGQAYTPYDIWKQTPLKDYIYSNYRPFDIVYHSPSYRLIVFWEPSTEENIELEGKGEYNYRIAYLYPDVRNGQYRGIKVVNDVRVSSPSDLYPSSDFVNYLSVRHLTGNALIIPNAWVGSGSHWKVSTGDVTSETWVKRNGDLITVFTETSAGHQISFIKMVYSPEIGAWKSLEIYENILGSFQPVYREVLVH